MSIKFIHFSDTHLGYSDLDKIDENGNNIREQDFNESFKFVIDYAVKVKPDFVLHSGDIFHRSSPTNKAIVFAYTQIKKLSDAGIPLYIVAGNHDYPKTVFTSPIHRVFDEFENVKVFFDEKYSVFETDDYILQVLPHINDEEKFALESVQIGINSKGKKNILSMHLSVNSKFKMDELGERVLSFDIENKLKEFDYVGLGHWHKFKHIKELGNTYYSGSTERLSEKEAGYEKGFLMVEISNKTNVEFIPLKLRKYIIIKIEKCNSKPKDKILKEISAKISNSEVKDSIITILLDEVEPARFYDITNSDFEDMFSEALYYSYKKTKAGSGDQQFFEGSAYDLREQLTVELEKAFIEKDQSQLAFKLINEMLTEIEEEEENANQ